MCDGLPGCSCPKCSLESMGYIQVKPSSKEKAKMQNIPHHSMEEVENGRKAQEEFREEYKQIFGCYPDEPAEPREINAAHYELELERRHVEQVNNCDSWLY